MLSRTTLSIFFILLGFAFTANSQSFLQADETNIVNEAGETVILRGMGLGGWMVQEGYMLQTSSFANPQWQIREKIEELIGADNTDLFYEAWLNNHVRKADIDSLKSWGFNSVRLPMHYNLYTLPIEDEPVQGEHTWLDLGFDMTDSLIDWCKQNEMYVILDLHAAPGGQGYDQGISDYDPSKPSLWESELNRQKTVALWKRLAERYADEKWVAGYDLINEPNWNLSGNIMLRNLYWEITDSIRTVDQNHILFIEGNWFANDFTGLTPPWDDNLVYSPHKYWSTNDQASIQWVLDLQAEHNVPLYFGESGENSNTWFRNAIALIESHGIGWAWWPMKKVESIAGPLSVLKTDDYQTLLNYWNNGGTVPDQAFATAALMELADNLRAENCVFQKDVVDAMFRQVQSDEAIPYAIQAIPGIVYTTDFDMGVVGSAYFDTDIANYHVSTGNYTAWNNGWAYRNDGVDIEVTNDNVNTNGYSLGWITSGEWMQYSIDVANSAVYDINIRVATEVSGAQFHLAANGSNISSITDVPNTGGWQSWETITVSDVILDENDTKLRFYIDEGTFNMGSMEVVQTGATTDLATEFLTAHTLDQHTVQLNFNKPLEGPLPSTSTDFYLFVDGGTVPITNKVLDDNNQRIIRLTTGHTFTNQEDITVSYIGTDINAQDGTSLEMFITQPVQNNIVEVHTVPGKIEAEDYFFQVGIEMEETTDVGGGENIGYLDVGDYLDYYIDVTQTGLYNVDYRTASETEGGAVKMQLIDDAGNAIDMQNISFPPTGGWQSWATSSGTLPFFSTGQKHIRIVITEPLFNMNWFEFSFLSPTEEVSSAFDISTYPNPGSGLFYLNGNFNTSEPLHLEIFNMLGQKIFSKSIATANILHESIDLRQAAKGCYVAVIRQGNKEVHFEKLIKE